MPTLPTVAPRWVVDPDFNLDFHVRRMRVPEPGTLRQVFDLAEVAAQSPLDISRPLWTATLVEGLEGGRAALMVHLSHAVTDGVGGVEMFANLYDLERDPPPQAPPPLPIPQDLSPNDLMRQGFNRLPGTIAGRVRGVLFGAAHVVGEMVRDPISRMGDVVEYAMSGARVVGPVAPPSPVLRRRSLSSRSEAIDIEFGALHKAAKAAGGSINDAYLAGLCGALRLYHQAKGVPIEALPMAVPVNLRSEADPAGGNRFAGVNLAAPIGLHDPEVRIKNIRSQMTRKREERAIDMVGAIAPVLTLMPDTVLESMAGSIVNSDVQASNVPVYAGDTFIAGAKVVAAVRHWPVARCGDDGRADLPCRLLHDHHTLRPRVDRRLRPVGSLPAGRVRRSARSRRRRSSRAGDVHDRRPRTHPSLTQRKCSAMTSANGQPNRRTMRLPGSVAEIEAQPARPRGWCLLRSRRHPRRRVHRRHHDPGSAAAAADVRRRVHRHGAGRPQPSARPLRVRGPHR